MPIDKTKKRVGRPITFTETKGINIIKALAAGETLTSYCKKKGNPSIHTVYGWVNHPDLTEFKQAFQLAREQGIETQVESITDRITQTPAINEELRKTDMLAKHVQWKAEKLVNRYKNNDYTQSINIMQVNVPARMSKSEWIESMRSENKIIDIDTSTNNNEYQSIEHNDSTIADENN